MSSPTSALALADILESWGDRLSVAAAAELRRLHRLNGVMLPTLREATTRLSYHHATRMLPIDAVVLARAKDVIQKANVKGNEHIEVTRSTPSAINKSTWSRQ